MSRVTRWSTSEKGGGGDAQDGKIAGKKGGKGEKKAPVGDGSVCRGGFSKVCGKELEGVDCVCCDVCQNWFHPACQKLSLSAFSAVCEYEFFWTCDVCRIKLPDIIEAGRNAINMNNKIDEVSEKINKHQEMMKEQLEVVTTLLMTQKAVQEDSSQKISKFEKNMEEVSAAMASETVGKKKFETSFKKMVKDEVKCVKDEVTEVVMTFGKEWKEGKLKSSETESSPRHATDVARSVRECMEQEKRKKNLVVHNLEEAESDKSLTEKFAHDKLAFQDMCKKTMKLSTRVERTYRIGKPRENRPRLLVVVMEDEATKWEVLGMAKRLRDFDDYNNIYVTPDLTPEEQAKDKALRAELKKRREDGEAVEIRRGRIVSRVGHGRNPSRSRTNTTQTQGTEVQVETVPKRVE